MPHQDIETITTRSAQAMRAHGADAVTAQIMADAIGWAEARGNRICGLYYLESYCQQLRSGRVQGAVQPGVSQPRPGEIIVDAGHGFAQPAFAAALAQAIKAARQQGILRLSVVNAHTCTALGWFCQQIAEAGLLGLGLTNASPIVAAPGGKRRVIGTNPICFAAPDGKGSVAMMFDQSTTAVALGHITMAKAAGRAIPQGWAVDADGQPTTDPEAALKGSLVSAGGYKGWGFGLMAEILTSCLTGGTPSREVKPLKAPEGAPHDLGHTFLLIAPGEDAVYDRIMALGEAVAQDEGCRMPGQGKASASFVDVPEALWAMVDRLTQGA